MSTYVCITREDLESWLTHIMQAEPYLKGLWHRDPRYEGIYLLPLSDHVAVKLSSTIGCDSAVMGVGQASMQLSLVSRHTGRTVNKKAQGQDHFKRTVNWRKTWLDGIERMYSAYIGAASFYDKIAQIENQDQYRAGYLKKIEQQQGWEKNTFLKSLHERLTGGGILSDAQEAALNRTEKPEPHSHPAESLSRDEETERFLVRLRNLYVVAKRSDDQWLLQFVTDIGKKIKDGSLRLDRLTQKQKDALDRNFTQHRVASRYLFG